jgi:hypothetical protein
MQFSNTLAVLAVACIAQVAAQFTIYDVWFHPGGQITRVSILPSHF